MSNEQDSQTDSSQSDVSNVDELPQGESPERQADVEAKSAESKSGVEPQKPVKAKGAGIAWLSLLLALAALGGAGYLYYESIYKDPLAEVKQQISSSAAKTADVSSEIAKITTAQADEFKSVLAEQQEQLAATEQNLVASLNEVANQAPPSQKQWKIAEVEYLLRIANHRVLMERDADGGLQLLETADAILAELDDFGFHEVRAQLADEVLALKSVGVDDLQGVFLRLEATKGQLDELPIKVPEYFTAGKTDADAEETPTTLVALRNAVSRFFEFRRVETTIKPLMAPQESMYLEMNLRLMVERAQLAALKRDQLVYEQSLSNALDWLEGYLDPSDQQVGALSEELSKLLDLNVERPLPDVSGSLSTFMETKRGAS